MTEQLNTKKLIVWLRDPKHYPDTDSILPHVSWKKERLNTIPLVIQEDWKELSVDELNEIDAPIREKGYATISEIYRAIEAKLKEKNGY